MSQISSESRRLAYNQLQKYINHGTFNKSKCDSIYISIEGNIGVGKTFLTEEIGKIIPEKYNEKCVIIKEEVNLDWLGAFIDNPLKHAGLFQIKRLCSTINAVNKMGIEMEIHQKYGSTVHCIGDRLPLGNFAFALVHHSMGNVDDEFFDLYGAALADGGPYIYPDIVLLLVKPDITLERIKKRDRKGESSYTIDYLEKLDEANLFTILCMIISKVINIYPVIWDEFGNTDDVLKLIKKRSFVLPMRLQKEIRETIFCMKYERMREIMYEIANLYQEL